MKLVLKLTRLRPFVVKTCAPICPPAARLKLLKRKCSERRIDMIRETMTTLGDSKLRPTEFAKIKSVTRQFEAIGIDDHARSASGKWRI